MKTKEVDVAVIGGGHNGLICAAYLARTGLKVCVLEARHEAGGGLDGLETSGFRHQPHAIYHMMAELMPAHLDLDLPGKGIRYIYPEVQASYINKNYKPVVFYKDPVKTAEYLGATFSSEDGKKYLEMHKEFTEYAEKILIPLTYVTPIPAIEQVAGLEAALDDVGARCNEATEMTPMEILDEWEFSEPVQAALINLFSMFGSSPNESLGYLFPLMITRMTNSALIAGGSHRLAGALARAVVEAGGEILENAEAVKVTMKNGAVDGVICRDGREIKAKAVASTVDPKQSFLKFFDADQIDSDLVASGENWQWEKTTFFGMHLNLKEAPKYINTEGCDDANKAMMTFLGIHDTDEFLDHFASVEDGQLPDENLYGRTTTATLFDPIMAPPGMHTGRWESMVPYDADWDNITDEYAAKCIADWKSWAPNLQHIGKYISPPTFIAKKFLNMVKGSIKSGAYSPLQMGYFRPNANASKGYTSIDGFYMCGAGSYPGGMILGGAGYKGANVIAEDMEVDKTWDEPEMVTLGRERGIISDDA
jgi:phytoene dehydrogenase-like protein